MRFGFVRLLLRSRPPSASLLGRPVHRQVFWASKQSTIARARPFSTSFKRLEAELDYYSDMSIENLYEIKGIKPLMVIPSGETTEVQGSGSSSYTLKAHDEYALLSNCGIELTLSSHYVCSCVSLALWPLDQADSVRSRLGRCRKAHLSMVERRLFNPVMSAV